MAPKFEAGETVWLHPYLPVRQGDYVVAQIVGATEADPNARLQFVSRDARELVLRQLNPPAGQVELIRIPNDRVYYVHKAVFAQFV